VFRETKKKDAKWKPYAMCIHPRKNPKKQFISGQHQNLTSFLITINAREYIDSYSSAIETKITL
jgi:hypothetical protein